jgi:hypothetical protein
MLDIDLERAEQTIRQHVGDLAPWDGCFALVAGARLVGLFSSYTVAADARRAMYDPDAGLICRIDARLPPVLVIGGETVFPKFAGYPVYQPTMGKLYAA